MTRVGKLTNTGDLQIRGELNSRLPSVTNGLVAHYSFDGSTKGELWGSGWSGSVVADSHIHDVTNTQCSLIAGQTVYFSGWFKSNAINGQVTFYVYHQINGVWSYQGISIQNSFVTGDWIYIERTITIAGTPTDTQSNWRQGISVRESCTSGSVEWKDCRCKIDCTSNNCTLTDDGIYVEEATTNLWSGGFSIYNNYGVPATLTKLNETYLGQPIYRESMTVDTAHSSNLSNFQTTFGNHGVYGSSRTYLANTKYAISVYWKALNKQDVKVGLTASNIGGWTDLITYSIGDGWNRSTAYRDGTVTTDKSDAIFFSFRSPSLQLNEPVLIDWCCPQIEQGRTYATSYISGSRYASDQGLRIPMMIKSFPFSVTIDVLPDIKNGVNSSYGSEPQLMYIAGLWSNQFSSYSGQIHQVARSAIKNGLENGFRYTVVYKNATYWDAYFNDTLIISNGTYYQSNYIFDIPYYTVGARGYETSLGYANAKYSNLSFYNRELSKTDISKLCNNKFSIKSNGDLIDTDIIEGYINVPKDAYYYPLDFDSKDQNKVYSSSEDTNTIYEDGAVWVGSGGTNLFPVCSDGIFPVTAGTPFEVVQNNNKSVIYKHRFNQELWQYKGVDIAVHSGETYTVSMDIFVSENFNGNYGMMANIEQTGSHAFNYDMTQKGTWQTFSSTFSVTSQGNSRILMYPCCNNTSATTGYVMYRNVIVTQKPFTSPFTPSTRGDSALEFNLNASIGLDWSKDWSIVYWKNPVGTHSNDMNGYNLESLGCNGNTVGGNGGYLWIGKNNSGSNNIMIIGSTNMGAISPTSYFNNWHMVSMQKTGATITIKHWSPSGTLVGTAPTTNSISNFFVTQYGYDLKLGGWDNVNYCNSYYKDLVITKNRCMTDEEVSNLYKRKMSKIDNLYLQGQLNEVIEL